MAKPLIRMRVKVLLLYCWILQVAKDRSYIL